MYYAIQNIKANEIICFVGSDVYPLRTQADFLAATGYICNSDKDYSTGSQVETKIPNLINQERDNIKKLIKAKSKATGLLKNNINNVITRKAEGLLNLKQV